MTIPGPFTDRVVVVSGSSRGIGHALACAFAREGATVVVTARTRERAEAAARTMPQAGGRALGLALEVQSAVSCADLAADAAKACGRVDVLVNNAAIFPRGTVAAMDEADWRRTLDVNLTGAYLLTRALLPHLARPGGRIVNLVSGLAVAGVYGGAAYAASKAGVMALTRSLALELAADGINVNAVSPGLVDTDMVRGAYSEDELNRLFSMLPGGRAGRPEDVAGTVLHLASPASAAMTGQVLFLRTPVPFGAPPRS